MDCTYTMWCWIHFPYQYFHKPPVIESRLPFFSGIFQLSVCFALSSSFQSCTHTHTHTHAYAQHRNEQLRDGLLSLAHSSSELENKLERHEQRERALGEIIKRGLTTLQKGQKIFEPMRGTFARLDERIGQIETILLEKDEKFNEQQSKMNKMIDLVEKFIASQEKPSSDSDRLVELSNQVEDLSVNVKELRKDMSTVSSKQNEIPTIFQESLTNLGSKLGKKLDENVDTMAKMEEKKALAASNASWQEQISQDLQHIKMNLGAGASCNAATADSADNINKDFLSALNNQTLDAIADMRHAIVTTSDQNQLKTIAKLSETSTALEASARNSGNGGIDSSCADVRTAIDDVKRNIRELNKLEQMMALVGDNVLSIRRGQEFSALKITSEVSDAIKLNAIEMNETINSQIRAINETILTNHNGALANLTQKIETEISQVWRQIGIMYQEVSSSKDALNKLQELTEAYVNGTVSTMDSMEGKVNEIYTP